MLSFGQQHFQVGPNKLPSIYVYKIYIQHRIYTANVHYFNTHSSVNSSFKKSALAVLLITGKRWMKVQPPRQTITTWLQISSRHFRTACWSQTAPFYRYRAVKGTPAHYPHTVTYRRANKKQFYLHDRLNWWKIQKVPRGPISSCRPAHRWPNLLAFFLSSNWCTDGKNCRRAHAPKADRNRYIFFKGVFMLCFFPPFIMGELNSQDKNNLQLRGMNAPRQGNNSEIVAALIILMGTRATS